MNKKGLSPVIATLMLIGLVVVLSTIVFLWARSFIGEAVQKKGMPAEQACESIVLSAVYSLEVLQVSNDGNIAVHKLTTLVEEDGNIDAQENTDPILPGSSIDIGLTTDSEEIELVPWILGDNKNVYKCEKSFKAEIA